MFSTKQNKLVTNKIQTEMDKHFLKQTNELNQTLDKNETDGFIQTWSSIVEEAVLDAGQIEDPKERKRYKGHGDVQMDTNKYTDLINFQQTH